MGSKMFYDDVICRYDKMDDHLDDYDTAIQDVLDNVDFDEYIYKIIEEKFADKDFLYKKGDGSIRWITYNPDSYAGGQFIDLSFSDDLPDFAMRIGKNPSEYILSKRDATLIDKNDDNFLPYAYELLSSKPDWDNFEDMLDDICFGRNQKRKKAINDYDNGKPFPDNEAFKGLKNYHIIAEINDTVLGVRKTDYKYATWIGGSSDGVISGHYDLDRETAFEDFALRAGLVDPDRYISSMDKELFEDLKSKKESSNSYISFGDEDDELLDMTSTADRKK